MNAIVIFTESWHQDKKCDIDGKLIHCMQVVVVTMHWNTIHQSLIFRVCFFNKKSGNMTQVFYQSVKAAN